MMETHDRLQDIIDLAIEEWPERFSAHIENCSGDKYTVKGLYEVEETLTRKYLGRPDSILYFNANYAIYGVAHETARDHAEIDFKQLPAESIRRDFVRRLHEAIEDAELGWTDDEKRLARDVLDNAS